MNSPVSPASRRPTTLVFMLQFKFKLTSDHTLSLCLRERSERRRPVCDSVFPATAGTEQEERLRLYPSKELFALWE